VTEPTDGDDDPLSFLKPSTPKPKDAPDDFDDNARDCCPPPTVEKLECSTHP